MAEPDSQETRASRRPQDESATQAKQTSKAKSDGKRTHGTLLLAAEAAAKVSGTAGTVQEVLERTALGHYAQGLRQYLAIRLGDAAEAEVAFAKLRDGVADVGMDTLGSPPGIRARLFRLARELSNELVSAKPPKPTKTLMWFGQGSGPGVRAIREDARSGDRELLELRHARSLDTEEMAFVLGIEPAAVETRLDAAMEEARKLFSTGKSDMPKALLEAFALEQLSSEISSGSESEEDTRVPDGTVLDGRYELMKHIGTGGFADVYRARDLGVDGHVVALKLLKQPSTSKRSRDAALRELRLIASVFHPSIVQFKDHGWHEDRFWFVMPWYEGQSLEDRLRDGPMPRDEARRIFEPLARALATMHESGMRHQDVKPDNIFLAQLKTGADDDEQILPVLIDLGVAATDAELVLAGTPTYFAPEVAAQFAYREGDPFPDRPIGPAADVYALALSLRNALEPATQPDVVGGNVDAFIRERAIEKPPLPTSSDLKYLRSHFERWLSGDPEERPTADEFVGALAVLTEPEERRARRLRVLRVFGPIVLALFIVFGVVAHRLMTEAQVHADKAAALEMEAAEAHADLEDSAAQRSALETSVREAESRIQNAQLSRQELEAQLADKEGRLGVEQSRSARYRRQITELDKQRDAARASLQTAERALATERQRIATLESQVTDRDAQLAQAQRREAALSAERDRARAEVEAFDRERESARRALAEAETRVAAAERERDAARAEQRSAEAERDQAQRALQTAERRIRQLERSGSTGGGTTTNTDPDPDPDPVQPPVVERDPPTTMRPSVMIRR